jgi:hypothetical protein
MGHTQSEASAELGEQKRKTLHGIRRAPGHIPVKNGMQREGMKSPNQATNSFSPQGPGPALTGISLFILSAITTKREGFSQLFFFAVMEIRSRVLPMEEWLLALCN